MSSETFGFSVFRDWMREKQLKYSIFAVEAPVETIADELMKVFKVEQWQQNIEHTGTFADLQGVPIVKLKGSPWSIVYWNLQRPLNIKQDCRRMSQALDGKIIQLWENTSGLVEWVVWQDGEKQEECERMPGGDPPFLESSLRNIDRWVEQFEELYEGDEATLQEPLDNTFAELLGKQNVYIPAPNLNWSSEEVERVDLLVLPAKTLGMADFQKQMYEGHPEYAIFAVKAPIAQVSELVAQYCKASAWEKDIQEPVAIWNLRKKDSQYCLPVIQPSENEWTVVYWGMGYWQDIAEMCQEISSHLNTDVMEISEEDTSGAIGYSLFSQGRLLERMEWCDELYFESELREEPEFDDFETSEWDTMCRFINDRFIEEGIYIPTWDLEVTDELLEQVDLIPHS
ncbi:hypothetical protein [Leptolyngbya sp. GGD]|uniref:hypothetical protein n=1 Tax=Leptolyngbya sp. GGD TaxID=2997907 RepID=UPI00227C6464|nr:hypothetical protein [Leptolyngbya sp. GGD]MCY6488795.1 hypothetical protein [Leptolyngbya sp. GGD]